MNDREIDRKLRESPPVDRALLERIQSRIQADARPVRPLAARWVLGAELIAVALLVGFAAAWRVGFYAIHKFTAGQAAPIFASLGVLIILAAGAVTAAMIPGARQWVRPAPLTGIACLLLAGVFAAVFSDYSTSRFVPDGIACLKAGLMTAIPAGLLAWLVMRRGFVISGAAAGALAGLAGVLMLELHCPIFEAPHAMVWHVAVIPVSAMLGTAMARVRRR